ncbi:MAG: type VI secretion system protein TssA [Rhodospirillales bacterium]|nr:type VI secretion system protein TssA [Rhodospirillales bacterium]MDE1882345.1 type VI secretion system protein TssA [Rhodospirillales bacterium]MDE2390913.1 type VI secretion system protein TssA [Rhodospirillales bacterium]MDE2458707.1 type VI secretion system protein TssA [Rhodospirillales bacterium]
MAVEGLDLEDLLAPISEDNPVGADVREDFSPTSLYFRLRDARADARAAERAADANPGEVASPEGWRSVRALAVEILSQKAKDLEAAAWLTEALVRSDGLAGLAFGASLLGGLAERYWDNLFPLPDEDGMETRVAPVTGLNGEGGDGTLSQPLQKLPLFRDANGETVMLFQYQQSAELAAIADQKRVEARIAAGVVPYDAMLAAARAAPPGGYILLRRNLEAARTAWSAMGEIFDRLAGRDAPPTGRIAETLALVGEFVARYAPAEAAAVPPEGEVDAVSPAEGGREAPPGQPKRLASREDALATLGEIAEYFRRTEPQSPLAYTIDEAIRRGRLTWPELIAELVRDDQVRNSILNSLGLKTEG